MSEDKRLIDMTLGELLAILDERDRRAAEQRGAIAGLPSLVYGLDGICELYHCTKQTASRIKRSGRLDAAISQVSKKKFAINVSKALSLLPNNNN